MKISAAEQAYEYLYNGILSRELPLGSPISEPQISAALDMSRSPVREAIKRLEAEGLFTCHPNRGTFVIDFSRQDMEEIFELRILFETFALRRACENMDSKTIEKLEREIESLNEDSGPEEYFEYNRHLHRAIINYGGNGRMARFFRILAIQLNVINRITAEDPECFANVKKQHLQIIQAIKQRNYGLAKKHLTGHLQDVFERTMKVYFGPKIDRLA
jgi:DNA-binding GntR family transcriptional regulator